MESTSYIALSRQTALMRQMEIAANNIANAGSTGFKGEHALFAEHLARTPGAEPLSYVEDLAVARSTLQGDFTRTENALDLAIQGQGYFVVETPAGERYTRGGTFQSDADGAVVTTQGYRLLDDGGNAIKLPADAADLTVTADGTLRADGRQVARIRLVSFDNEQALRKTMGGLYTTDLAPQPAAEARVLQGMIEQANVKPVIEMTRMMEILRAFEATQKMIDGEHDRLTKAIRTLPETQPA